jgi:hypothetical protein
MYRHPHLSLASHVFGVLFRSMCAVFCVLTLVKILARTPVAPTFVDLIPGSVAFCAAFFSLALLALHTLDLASRYARSLR